VHDIKAVAEVVCVRAEKVRGECEAYNKIMYEGLLHRASEFVSAERCNHQVNEAVTLKFSRDCFSCLTLSLQICTNFLNCVMTKIFHQPLSSWGWQVFEKSERSLGDHKIALQFFYLNKVEGWCAKCHAKAISYENFADWFRLFTCVETS